MKKRFFDDELVQACQRLLDSLNKRNLEIEKAKEELRKEEEQKCVRREYWRKRLYGGNTSGISVIVPKDSKFR